MSAPEPRSPLAGFRPAPHAGSGGRPGLVAIERRAALVEVVARRGEDQAAAALLPPAAWALAPGRWLAVGPAGGVALDPALFAGKAALVDVGSAFAVLRLEGPAVRQVLARLCRLDLEAFRPGEAARTPMAQMPVLIAMLDPRPAYDLFVPATLARSFAEALAHAAASFGGCEIRPAGDTGP